MWYWRELVVHIDVRWLLEYTGVVKALTHIDPEGGLTEAWAGRVDDIVLRLAQQSIGSREMSFGVAPCFGDWEISA